MMKKGKQSIAEELRQFIETANAPIFGIDSNGLVNEWNQASEKITGFKKKEVLGQDLVAIYITEDYRKAVKRVLDNALKGEETANFEFPLFSKDGNRVMVLLNSSTRKNADGDIVGVLGVGQDITILNDYKENLESKVKDRTQELAFEDAEKDKRAAELVIANIELAFQNNEKEKRASELSIANIELAFQNEEKDKRANELAIANKELAFQIEEKDKRANELAIANKELAFQDREKEKRAYELVLANEEKGKRADELILANKELAFQNELEKNRIETESIAKELRQFIETANAPIFGIDSKGLVNEWNQASEKITGFKKEEVLGQDLVKTYITEDYREAVKKVLENALGGEETANYQFPLFAKDGKRVVVLLNSSTRRDAEGEIVGVLGVGQDITDLNEYKEDLEFKVKDRTQELEKSLLREQELGLLKSNFVSMASHEFRTPLTSISATSDVILRYFDRLSREDINKRLEKIKREVDDMTIMLEDILIIGRSDSQKLDYNPDILDIIDLIKNIIYEYQLSESKKRKIVYDLPLPVIIAKVDRKWIKHIVINLLTNAIKYSNEDTQIEISIKREPSGVSFSFRDYGVGISKEDISRLFEPFYRGSNVAGISGTGLGLIVLQKALELHNGKIEIASKIGEGSNFKVILPTGEPLQ
jgi:PAS domain S-box-containing protein